LTIPKVHEESAIAGYGAGNSFSQPSFARFACADLRQQARYASVDEAQLCFTDFATGTEMWRNFGELE